jgi:signal transduction histidine kinase
MRFGFVALIVFLVLAAAIQLVVLGRQRLAADAVRTLEKLELTNAESFTHLTEAEGALSGYQLVGDSASRASYLAAYKDAMGQYRTTSGLVSAGAPDAGIKRLATAAQTAVNAWLKGYATPLAGTPKPSADSRRLAAGASLFTAVHTAHQALGAALAARAANAADELATKIRNARMTGVLVLLAAGLLTALVALRIRREVAAPLDAIGQLNARLLGGEPSARAPVGGPPAVQALMSDANRVAAELERCLAVEETRKLVRQLADPSGTGGPRGRSDLERALNDVAMRVATALAVERVYIRVTVGLAVEDERPTLVAQWHADELPKLSEEFPVLPRDPRTEGLPGTPDVHPNLRADPILYGDNPRAEAARALATDADVRALVCTQITAAGQPCGALMALDCTGPRSWTQGELDLLTAVTADLGRIVEAAKLAADQHRLARDQQVFIATASHELRTPLASILGYLELLAVGDFGELTEEQRSAVAVVERNTARLHELVRDLLTISGVAPVAEPVERPPVDLGEVAAAVRSALTPRAVQAQVELRYQERSPATVFGDDRQLERALTALVDNAISFTPVGGAVTITLDQDVNFTASRGRIGGARLTVSDNGIGIPEAELTRVLEPFYRGTNAVEQGISGSGLGLSIAVMMVRQHDGVLKVVSRPGEGTEVTIRLPLAQRTSAGAPGTTVSWA